MAGYQVLITSSKHDAVATSIATFGTQSEALQAIKAIEQFHKDNRFMLNYSQNAILLNPD